MISIIIPTVKYDNLKACVDSIEKYTDIANIEVITVCNGMDPAKRSEIPTLCKVIWHDKMLGYPKAVNEGIKAAGTNDVILFNDDALLLPQARNTWIGMLSEPFKDPTVGITGPIANTNSFAVFFCVMISRKCLDTVGLLDENFGVGAGEDADFCIRAEKAGFKIVQVPVQTTLPSKEGLVIGGFPIYHQGESTVHDRTYVKNWVENCNKNCDYLDSKHPDHKLWRRYPLKLNLGCGPKITHLQGYTNIDLHDKDADLNLDAQDLSRFKDNSVDEIVASHLVEHFRPDHIITIFKEWLRVLKPGGKIILELPDIYECCKEFVRMTDTNDPHAWVMLSCMYGAFYDNDMGHKYGWTFSNLAGHMREAGFRGMIKLPQQWWHQGCNMRVEAWK